MSTTEILEQISRLSPTERLFIIEKSFKDLLRCNTIEQMTLASEALETEYKTNQELTASSLL